MTSVLARTSVCTPGDWRLLTGAGARFIIFADGKFLATEILRIRYEKMIKLVSPSNIICYCGSGVTAAHNLLAIAHAGLGIGKLYAGSWSEWVANPARPVARGYRDSELNQ
jgi:3-mercaptopyruvate sulfurtransferase SseA